MTAFEEMPLVLDELWRGHEARTHFLATGHVSPTVRDEVAASWRRSVTPPDTPASVGARHSTPTDGADARLLELARRVTHTGFSSGLDGVAVLVVTAGGRVIASAGDPCAVDAARRAGLGLGCDVSEASLGPSASGLCAAAAAFAHAAGPEHLRPALVGWTTAAVPLSVPGDERPIGQLVAAECTPRLDPMLASWVRVAGAVVQAEWRRTT